MRSWLARLLDFSVRTFIVVFAVYLAISAFLRPIDRAFDRIDRILNSFDAKISRLGEYVNLLTMSDLEAQTIEEISDLRWRLYGVSNNPEVHYQIALQRERRGDLVGAAREMSLAVGLVAPDAEKYQAKLEELRTRQALKASPR